jgi:hypothetical protein
MSASSRVDSQATNRRSAAVRVIDSVNQTRGFGDQAAAPRSISQNAGELTRCQQVRGLQA